MKRRVYIYLLAAIIMTVSQRGGAESTDTDDSRESLWPLCPSSLPVPERPLVDVPLAPGEVHITADEADLEEFGISNLRGNAEITRDSQQVSAESITYDQPKETADLEGDVEYWDNDIYLAGEKGSVDFTKDSGQFEHARYMVKSNRGRGEAGTIYHEYPVRSELSDVDYSTCDPEDNFWKLSADEIILDHEEERGVGKNVVLRIKDVPVLYTPYLNFPLSKKRKTGFLFPHLGTTNRNGYEMQTPFYWNIAPEMDATLTPRILSDSGLMMMGQFRYLLPRGQGQFNGEFLPSDNEFNDEDRSLFGFVHNQQYADTGRLFLTYNRVSDKQYFEDFGSSINISSIRYLERRAETSYRGRLWNVLARVQDYQTVDSSIPVTSRPYKRLPQLRFNAHSPNRNNSLNFDLGSEFSYFERGDNDVFINDVNGSRVDLFPSVSFPMYSASTFLIPKTGFRFTQYSLSDTGPDFKSSPSRALPMASLDTGVFFERDTNIFGSSFLQTLEPRLFYLFIPFEDQDDLPVFDTSLYDFSFDSLFREDRFTGADRMGDANQVTLALTSRLIDQDTGIEAGYVSLGQIYYFRDLEVTLPGDPDKDEGSSSFVAEVGTSIIDDLRLRGTVQWDPHNNRTEKVVAMAQYQPEANKIINAGYRVRRIFDRSVSTLQAFDNIEQTELSFVWPITHKWNVLGRWNYALPESKTLDVFAGVEYDSCCWAFRTVARRFLTDVNGDYNTGIFFQIELKGLAGIGQSTEDFLSENIRGYQSAF